MIKDDFSLIDNRTQVTIINHFSFSALLKIFKKRNFCFINIFFATNLLRQFSKITCLKSSKKSKLYLKNSLFYSWKNHLYNYISHKYSCICSSTNYMNLQCSYIGSSTNYMNFPYNYTSFSYNYMSFPTNYMRLSTNYMNLQCSYTEASCNCMEGCIYGKNKLK